MSEPIYKPEPLVPTQRRVDVLFHASGRIDIKAGVSRTLSLQEGDAINILHVGTEYYLYVSKRAASVQCSQARFRNAVYSVIRRNGKRLYNSFRCQSIDLVRQVSQITGSPESWLFVGDPRDLHQYGIPETGLPLICSNNQYIP